MADWHAIVDDDAAEGVREGERVLEALQDLRDAIFAFYTAMEKVERERPPGWSEHECREAALQDIDEALGYRPLSAFPASRLEMLESLIGFWRERWGSPPARAGA